jgi:hypothetical protein
LRKCSRSGLVSRCSCLQNLSCPTQARGLPAKSRQPAIIDLDATRSVGSRSSLVMLQPQPSHHHWDIGVSGILLVTPAPGSTLYVHLKPQRGYITAAGIRMATTQLPVSSVDKGQNNSTNGRPTRPPPQMGGRRDLHLHKVQSSTSTDHRLTDAATAVEASCEFGAGQNWVHYSGRYYLILVFHSA